MQFNSLTLFFWLLGVLSQLASALPAVTPTDGTVEILDLEKRDNLVQATFDNLVRYAKYSSGAYQVYCARPLGNKLVKSFSASSTSTQGFIARDDGRKEYIVAFRGSQQLTDFLFDAMIIQQKLSITGVSTSSSSSPVNVHMGFQTAFNSVASQILSTLKSELSSHPGYSVVVTGHSLGGALASLGAVMVKSNLPGVNVKMYTYGQPRTGNAAYASLAENLIGTSNIFRSVHTFDGVPTMLAQFLGYRHHGTEYWQFADPSSTGKIKVCKGGEDATCSVSIPSTGINLAHPLYYGQVMSLDPFVCL